MSNCIRIDNPRLVFSPRDIDARRLLTDLAAHDGHGGRYRCPLVPNGDDWKDKTIQDAAWTCDMGYWYLVSGQNMHLLDDGSLEVFLGQGNSIHTNRDLKSTLIFLGKYLLRPKKLSLKIRDECDGFRYQFRNTAWLRPNENLMWDGEEEMIKRLSLQTSKPVITLVKPPPAKRVGF